MFVDIKVGYASNHHCIHCVMEVFHRELRSNGERRTATLDQAEIRELSVLRL